MDEKRVCHCGKELPPQRWAKHGGGRPRKHCSPRCTQRATTSRAYGLAPSEYWEILQKQNGACAICNFVPAEGDRLLAVDHEHVEGFSEMPSHERRKYVRGLLCILCNKHRMAKTDLTMARRMVEYLEAYSAEKIF